jgi:alpha-tubulin suppressor-like RCC1 family protein
MQQRWVMTWAVVLVACASGAPPETPKPALQDAGTTADGAKADATVTPATTASKLSVGGQFACAAISDGTVRCWGWNGNAQLGIGLKPTAYGAGPPRELWPTAVKGLKTPLDLAAGETHACARFADSVQCWGSNAFGEVGNGRDQLAFGAGTLAVEPMPEPVQGLKDATWVTAGVQFTCAARAAGFTACWGDNGDGSLGIGDGPSSAVPVLVKMSAGPKALAAGSRHVCAAKKDGTVWCWGLNDKGQAVPGGEVKIGIPAQVGGLDGAVTLAAGATHTCAVVADKGVRCWGDAAAGQLGGSGKGLVTVSGVAGVVALAAGRQHTCALDGDGKVLCWGASTMGQLGGAGAGVVTVAGVVATAIAAGGDTTCALTKQGTVVCWGAGSHGQLGTGQAVDKGAPQAVQWDPPKPVEVDAEDGDATAADAGDIDVPARRVDASDAGDACVWKPPFQLCEPDGGHDSK